MKQKPGWVLPDLKEAQKRTTKTIDRIDTFTIPEAARMMGRGKTYFISTYGCQANERDSETIAGILDELGFTPNETPENSDVIIINTCAIQPQTPIIKSLFSRYRRLKLPISPNTFSSAF